MSGPQKPNIGLDYVTNIYSDAEIETENPQPLYILHKDTIKSFLSEKMDELNKTGLLWGYIGIELTIAITLLTTDVKGIWLISGQLIKGTLVAFSGIVGFLIVKNIEHIKNPKNEVKMESLVCELGKRGTIVKPVRSQPKLEQKSSLPSSSSATAATTPE